MFVRDVEFAGSLRGELLKLQQDGGRAVHRAVWEERGLAARMMNWIAYGLARAMTGWLGGRASRW